VNIDAEIFKRTAMLHYTRGFLLGLASRKLLWFIKKDLIEMANDIASVLEGK
jgi:hypothetical protein